MPKVDLTILHVGTVLLCFMIVMLSLTKLIGLQRWLHQRYFPEPPFLPSVDVLYADFLGYTELHHCTIHYLAITPFAVPPHPRHGPNSLHYNYI